MIAGMKSDSGVITMSWYEQFLIKIIDSNTEIQKENHQEAIKKCFSEIVNCKSCDDICVINTLFACCLSLGNILWRQKVTIISNM